MTSELQNCIPAADLPASCVSCTTIPGMLKFDFASQLLPLNIMSFEANRGMLKKKSSMSNNSFFRLCLRLKVSFKTSDGVYFFEFILLE